MSDKGLNQEARIVDVLNFVDLQGPLNRMVDPSLKNTRNDLLTYSFFVIIIDERAKLRNQ
jgi:hypothetical protein